jgi:hypothetical protein
MRLVDMHFVAPIMFWRWSNVPTVQAMGISGGTLLGFLMGNSTRACWCHGGMVEILVTFKLCICWNMRVDP